MKLVTMKPNKLRGYSCDKEMLHNSDRPCVLIVNLTYKGRRYDFAVPLRSNINPSAPKNQYFALPPRSKTKPQHRHGVHYIKMFPVNREWSERFHSENDVYMAMIKALLDANEKQIIAACQAYLSDYEKGCIPKYATDIDYLITLL